jgi:hypothetical protein
MDWDAHLRETARHLVWMARLPGELALEQAKHREQELMRDPLYAQLPEFVRQARRERDEGQS